MQRTKTQKHMIFLIYLQELLAAQLKKITKGYKRVGYSMDMSDYRHNHGNLIALWWAMPQTHMTTLTRFWSTTDAARFCRERVGEVFLFAKINKRICGPLLMMEKILYVWRYCSSNLNVFHVQISFSVSSSKPAFQQNCIKQLQPSVFETKYIIITWSH